MDYRFAKYQTVAERKEMARKSVEALMKKDKNLEPVVIEGKKLATNWWGLAWNQNLQSYADYSNRIGRGRTYVRNGSVIDLKINKGTVTGLVQGSRKIPYKVKITIDTLSPKRQERIIQLCNNRIASLESLIDGKFPEELKVIFTEKEYGMFPAPKEIYFSCSCPDSAYMCKHVASVLYGVGSRLDKDPMLFFELRDMDGASLVRKSMEKRLDNMLKNAHIKSNRTIDEKDIFNIFGV
ncbi:MAG TPA: SWIM zinc finger family protein [Thermotogota bacterium]|nr:SWIM zinc finger family protein [Thermotogota bacterium]